MNQLLFERYLKNFRETLRENLKRPLGERSHHLLHTDHDGWSAK